MGRTGRTLAAACLVLAVGACGNETAATTTTAAEPVATTVAEVTTSAAPATTEAVFEAHPLDLTSEEICDIVPAAEVADLLGVTVDEAVAFSDGTPQCSYQFLLADGMVNNAIVNVPTINRDLGGRSGDDAFDYVLSLYDDSDYEVTDLDTGDRSVVLTSPPGDDGGVHVGVIRLGERVVITIVSAGLVEYDGFLQMNDLVADLLPPEK